MTYIGQRTWTEGYPVLSYTVATTKGSIADRVQDLSLELAAIANELRKPPEPTPVPPVPPSVDPFSRPLLTPDKLEYVGSAWLPPFVGNWSTAYGTGTLTHRYLNGKLRLFSTANWNPSLGDSMPFEFELPQDLSRDFAALSTCSPLASYSAYGREKDLNGKPSIVHCLYWDEQDQVLAWTFGPEYSDAATQLLPCVGCTELDGVNVVDITQSWRADVSTQFTRGGATRIPEWFTKYVDGYDYALGFGGYFSMHGGGWGPALLACDEPKNGVATTKKLIYFPPKKRAWRASDFYGVPGDETIAGPNEWTWCDELGGDTHASSFLWVDLPDYRGALFVPSMGTGKCWYDQQSRWIQSEGRRIEWRIVDEADLRDGNYRATVLPWDSPLVKPAGSPRHTRFGGLTLDKTTRTLYAVECHAAMPRQLGPDQVEPRHAIHAWRIK